MKKILSALILVTLVWGCAKKIAPSNSGISSGPANTPAETNVGKESSGSVSAAATTGSQAPVENTGTFGTKEAPKPTNAGETAAITGQSIFNAKCGRCHGLKVTTDYTADRWASILAVMAPRANLTDAERENVYAYVKANAKK